MSDARPLEPVYLIVGNDRPKVRRALARLRQRVIDESGSDLNINAFEVDKARSAEALRDVLEAAATPGFALGVRLLIVQNADLFRPAERRALAGYAADPMPGTCLTVQASSLPADDPLRKAVPKKGLLTFDLPKRYEMAGWVAGRAKAHRLSMSTAVARHLVDVCGQDPDRSELLEREIEKLALYCRGTAATVADVDAVCTPDDEARVFDLMDAVGLRERARALALLEKMFAGGDSRDDAGPVLFRLTRHVRLLDVASHLAPDQEGNAARVLGVHSFTARKALEQRKHWDRRRFAAAYRALAVAEAGMRGRPPATLETAAGVSNTDRLALEVALVKLLA